MFHGRGGAIGRGGGPPTGPSWPRARLDRRATQAHRAGRGHRRALLRPDIAPPPRTATGAVLLASSPEHEARPTRHLSRRAGHRGAGRHLADRFRAPVYDDPGFAAFFRAATPIEELADLAWLPARRAGPPRRADDRCAPRHPVGVRLVAVTDQPAGLVRAGGRLRRVSVRPWRCGSADRAARREWPFLSSLLTTPRSAWPRQTSASPASTPTWPRVRATTGAGTRSRAEYRRTVALLVRVTGREGPCRPAARARPR